MTQWINSWFRHLTTVLVLSLYEQINADSEWCGKASQVFFFFFFSVFAGDTLTQCTTFSRFISLYNSYDKNQSKSYSQTVSTWFANTIII